MKSKYINIAFLCLFSLYLPAQCDNIMSGGLIAEDQFFCGTTEVDPDIIANIEPPSGGSGDQEILWIYTNADPSNSTNVWYAIPNSNSLEFDPPLITETTYYRRCTRRAGCSEYIGESNIVEITIADDCSGGENQDCDAFKVAIESTIDANCENTFGSANISIVAGTMPFIYTLNGTIIEDLPFTYLPGDYTISVTDANDCTDSQSFSIYETSSSLTVNANILDPSCEANNGSITLDIIGVEGNYTILWSDNNTDQHRENLGEGVYSVTISDENACSISSEFILSSSNDEILIDLWPNDVSCSGMNDGSAEVNLSGGVFPYRIFLNDVEVNIIENLAPGNYSLVVFDENGCSSESTFTINNANPINVAGQTTPESCQENNGSISLNISGGSAPFTIQWSDGTQNVSERENLGAGNYSVLVTNALGCSTSQDFFVASIGDLAVSLSTTNSSCFGAENGSVNINFEGGQAPFNFNLNGEELETLPSVLGVDQYQLIVTDANGCIALAEFEITQPDPIIYLAEINDPLCAGGTGSINIENVVGGTSIYSFLWSDGSTQQNRNNLEIGTYTLTISDSNNCYVSSENFDIINPNPISISHQITNISCIGNNNGAVDIEVNGGMPPYSYFWSNGAVTQDLENLAPGEYVIEVTDSNGCTTEFSTFISNPTSFLTADVSTTLANCGVSDGTATATPSGGTPPYFYSWDSGNTDITETNLSKGEYTLTISDFAGCNQIITFEIEEIDCLEEENGGSFNFVTINSNADVKNETVSLHWVTKDEAIEGYFIIEHSMDGVNFESVSELMEGYGFSLSENEYLIDFDERRLGTHYFRVKYVDSNGNLALSDIVETVFEPLNSASFSIFPNPTMNEITLNFYTILEEETPLQLVNAQAGVLENVLVPSGILRYSVDMSTRMPGVYYLVVQKKGKRMVSQKFIKIE